VQHWHLLGSTIPNHYLPDAKILNEAELVLLEVKRRMR
jgi:hypothetical protein